MQTFRVFFQVGRVGGPENCGNKYQDVPSVKLQLQQRRQLPAGYDHQNAAEGGEHSQTLPETEAVIVHPPGNERYNDRDTGVDQYRIDSGGGLQGQINETVEACHPQYTLDDQKIFVF